MLGGTDTDLHDNLGWEKENPVSSFCCKRMNLVSYPGNPVNNIKSSYYLHLFFFIDMNVCAQLNFLVNFFLLRVNRPETIWLDFRQMQILG